MDQVTVYRMKPKYDISTDNFVSSRRWMTNEQAQKVGLEIILETEREIPRHDLENGEGWTKIGYYPSSFPGGVQNRVLS